MDLKANAGRGSMKKVVVIGGGTGSYTVLRGLKHYDLDITSVVSMFDSGGSTGRLRDEFGMLPPGDVRRALIALADDNAAGVLRQLFEYRYDRGNGLDGHNLGNLMLTALTDIYKSDAKAIEQAGNILNIKGRVLPVSLTNTQLCARLDNGQEIVGETNIDLPKHDPKNKIWQLYLQKPAELYEPTRKAIAEADLIVIGPGDIYSSVLPNMLVSGMPEALRTSKARLAYVCNLMTKNGETDGFAASHHAREILKYAPGIELDYIVCNSRASDKRLLEKYAAEQSFPVRIDERVHERAKKVILEDLITEPELIRHDSGKLATVLVDIATPLVIFDLDDTLFSTTEQLQGTYTNLLNITPAREAKRVLDAPGYRKVLVTRGDPRIQRKKIDILGIKDAFDDIEVCATSEDKKKCFERVITKYNKLPGDVIVVGDRIDSEIKYGNELGCRTILIAKGGKYASLAPKDKREQPTHTIESLDKLLKVI